MESNRKSWKSQVTLLLSSWTWVFWSLCSFLKLISLVNSCSNKIGTRNNISRISSNTLPPAVYCPDKDNRWVKKGRVIRFPGDFTMGVVNIGTVAYPELSHIVISRLLTVGLERLSLFQNSRDWMTRILSSVQCEPGWPVVCRSLFAFFPASLSAGLCFPAASPDVSRPHVTWVTLVFCAVMYSSEKKS